MTKSLLRSLAGRDFRLYFGGQFISFIGTWIQQVALAWIAYRISGSAVLLGVVAFALQAPSLLLGPLGGVVADRFDRRRILLTVHCCELGIALALALLAMRGALTPQALVAASLLLGVAASFAMPARQAFVAELVREHRHLTNAIALNSASFNLARLLGPALGAVMLAELGDAACFFANAGSYVFQIGAILLLKPAGRLPRHAHCTTRHALHYLRHAAMPRSLLVTVALSSVALAPLVTLLPVFTGELFGRDVDALGLLMAASGLGALAAGLALATRPHVSGFSLRVVAGCLCAAAAAALLTCNPHFPVALALMVVSGWSTVMIVTSSHILLQAVIPEHLRGQLMAFFGMACGGALALASLASGALAESVGTRPLFLASALLYLAIGVALHRALPALRREARVILLEKGLVPK